MKIAQVSVSFKEANENGEWGRANHWPLAASLVTVMLARAFKWSGRTRKLLIWTPYWKLRTSRHQEEAQNVDQEPLEDSDVTSESGKKGSKRQLFKSPSARSHSQKIHMFSATEEALSIMKDVQVRNALKDQYTASGDQVGMRIRDLPTLNAKQIVKHLISNILFEAEMGKYDNLNSVNTTCTLFTICHTFLSHHFLPLLYLDIFLVTLHILNSVLILVKCRRSFNTHYQAPRRHVHMRLLTMILWTLF
ncbi:hypothetical protein JTB14_010747 [Gonioctena quinquepunctata]|nr:hypothetical protein JTB14_010747 [Gonioctena quinquepunctata]